MRKILYLSFYFEPDLCAGSFRNSSLLAEVASQFEGKIDLFTSMPNRYNTFQITAEQFEKRKNVNIYRIKLPNHKSGFIDQILAFRKYYREVMKFTKNNNYDLVFASSSRLFTAFLAFKIAKKNKIPLYLDIRDIFTDTIKDIFRKKIIRFLILPILNKIEYKVFRYATHINLISGGFAKYFEKFSNAHISTFSNGIDNEFLSLPKSKVIEKDRYLITYAGNIGEGQGLHKIIPQAASLLTEKFDFLIIGDGGSKSKLIQVLNKLNLKNVQLLSPINRKELIQIYCKSDFLFIHLNDLNAFKKVLPSKLFELAAFDKPIIAGVGGFAREFIESEILNKIVFEPCNVNEFVDQIQKFTYNTKFRDDFIVKFKRENIDKSLAESILSYIK